MSVRGPIVEINLENIKHNFNYIRGLADNAAITAVVKADAYGHGAVEVARLLETLNVDCLGAAYNCEAVELRQAGIKTPIIVFFNDVNGDEINDYDLTPVLFNEENAKKLSNYGKAKNKTFSAHINIDTGMGRLGFLFDRDADKIKNVTALPNINIIGWMSHFSEADLYDRSFANLQLDRFKTVKQEISASVNKNAKWHIANSAASLTFKEAHLDMIRPGLMLYGINPCAYGDFQLKPAMSVKSRLIDVRRVPAGRSISYGRTFTTQRDSLIGVMAVGYADGLWRVLSNSVRVIVNGQYAPLVGRICMDTAMIDLTDIKDVPQDALVTLLGKEGSAEITANELAAKSNTIAYEILTAFGKAKNKTFFID
ncbi:alanine racemase [Candidatus Magnetoovum chiemensis]|nr:alanine racemase [Candidatus Magnetoovum chiemensis]